MGENSILVFKKIKRRLVHEAKCGLNPFVFKYKYFIAGKVHLWIIYEQLRGCCRASPLVWCRGFVNRSAQGGIQTRKSRGEAKENKVES